MNRAFKESFVPILGLLGLLFLLLLYVRYQVGLDAGEVTVITIQASASDVTDDDLLEEEPDVFLAADKQGSEIFDLIVENQWQQAELRVNQLIKQRDDALAWSLFGILRYKQQQDKEALMLLDSAATKSPVWPTLFFYRGLVNSRLGNLDAAQADYRRIMQFNENHFEAHYNLGLLLIRQDEFAEAVTVLKRATTLAGGGRRARAHYQLGRAWAEQGEALWDGARSNFNLAIRHLPGFIEPRIALAKLHPDNEEGWAASERELQEILELDTGNASVLFALAQLATAKGLTTVAISRYQQLLQYAPEHIAGRYNLGLLLLKDKKWREARDQFSRVLESEPKNVTALFNRGRANYRIEEYSMALADYHLALDLRKGDYPEVLLNIGLVHVALQDFNAAQQSYRQALSLREDYPSAWYNLGLLYMRQEQTEEAIKAFNRAVTLRKEYVQAWYNLGVLYGRQEQNDKSIAAYEKALELRPDYTKARLNLAVRWSRVGQPAKAVEHYRKVLEEDATYSSAWYNLSLVYLELKQYEEAELAIHKMLAMEPDSVKARVLLADILTALGRHADAVGVLEEAVDIESDSTLLRLALAKNLRLTGQPEQARKEIYKGLALDPENQELHDELQLLETQFNKN